MKPVIALVGRPNVGKSTLFNRLTRSRDALVADFPGLTRDRQYGDGKLGDREYIVVDTGGIGEGEAGIDQPMTGQARQAAREADLVLFLVDGRAGVTAADEQIAAELRPLNKPALLVVNKTDGLDADLVAAEFYELGLASLYPVSASHGRGIRKLVDAMLAELPPEPDADGEADDDQPDEGICIAVLGRPNVGKSTLVNRMLGEERVVVYDEAGTTRDAIRIPYERRGEHYTLIDTAGIRRRGRVNETIEKFSVIKALQAVEAAHVVVLVVDAREGITDQDLHLLGMTLEAGRALVIAVNKWDGLEPDHKEKVKKELRRRLEFVPWARIQPMSALHGTGVGELYPLIHRAWASAYPEVSTNQLTRMLQDMVAQHQPPVVRRHRIKLRYAHLGGANPPVIVIHGNQVDATPDSYRRYLENRFREILDLEGTPVRVEMRGGSNPYAGKRNILTARQLRRRKRLLKRLKK